MRHLVHFVSLLSRSNVKSVFILKHRSSKNVASENVACPISSQLPYDTGIYYVSRWVVQKIIESFGNIQIMNWNDRYHRQLVDTHIMLCHRQVWFRLMAFYVTMLWRKRKVIATKLNTRHFRKRRFRNCDVFGRDVSGRDVSGRDVFGRDVFETATLS